MGLPEGLSTSKSCIQTKLRETHWQLPPRCDSHFQDLRFQFFGVEHQIYIGQLFDFQGDPGDALNARVSLVKFVKYVLRSSRTNWLWGSSHFTF